MMTDAALAILLVVISMLIFCSALFSGLETALFSLKPHQLRRLEEHRSGLTNFIQLFRDNPRHVLNVLLFFDFIPTLLAVSAPYPLSAIGALALQISMPLLDRVGHGLERVSAFIIDHLTPLHLRTRPGLSDEELHTLLEVGEEEGALQEEEAEMIDEIIKLGDKTAKDCMTPRVDSFTLPDDLTNEEAIARLKEKRHRRVPVYADTPDQILGIIDVKLFLLDPSEHYTEKLIAPSFVSETMGALELLKLFLTRPQGMGVVVDEFGGTEGIITMSDIVEEILS